MKKTTQLSGIRQAVNWAGTQKELAQKLGVSKSTVQSWVTKGYVPTQHIKEVEKLTGIPEEKLCNPKFLHNAKDKK
jgi:DNA-binding transcriptional regulator YdaS (Cro superfamily)